MIDALQKKESLLARAAEAQRRNGKLPNTRADDAVWSQILADTERRTAESKVAPKATLDTNPARSAEKAIAQSGGELLNGAAARREMRRMSPKRGTKTIEAKLALRRLRMLQLLPEWQTRVVDAINEGARQAVLRGVRDMRLLIWMEVRKVLDASSLAFGQWDRAPEQKVVVSG